MATAQFSLPRERSAILARAITRNDVLKTMLYVLLELDSVSDTAFIQLSPQLEEIGRMLYGWKNQAAKQAEKT